MKMGYLRHRCPPYLQTRDSPCSPRRHCCPIYQQVCTQLSIFKLISDMSLSAHRNFNLCCFSFSSSPGFVASIDDYYLLSGTSRLTVIETSNEVFNTSVYSLLTPETNMCWVRTMVYDGLCRFHYLFLWGIDLCLSSLKSTYVTNQHI